MLFIIRQAPSCALTERTHHKMSDYLTVDCKWSFYPSQWKWWVIKKKCLRLKITTFIQATNYHTHTSYKLPHSYRLQIPVIFLQRWAELLILLANMPLPMFVAGIRRKWPVIGSRTNWYPTGGRGRCSDGPNWTGTWAKDTNIECYRGKAPNLGCHNIYMEVLQNCADPEDVISASIHQTTWYVFVQHYLWPAQ